MVILVRKARLVREIKFSRNRLCFVSLNFTGELNYPGLLNFGKFGDLTYELPELFIFVLIGAAGGVFGALFNHLNHKLMIFRAKYSIFCIILRSKFHFFRRICF